MFPQSEVAADPTGEPALVAELHRLDAELNHLASERREWIRENFAMIEGRNVMRPGREAECRQAIPRETAYRQNCARLGSRRDQVLRSLARIRTGIEVTP